MSTRTIYKTICDPHESTGDEKEGTPEVFLVEGKIYRMDICEQCRRLPHQVLVEHAENLGVPDETHMRPKRLGIVPADKEERHGVCPFCSRNGLRGKKGDIYSRGVIQHVRQVHEEEYDHFQKHGRWSNDSSDRSDTA